MTPLPLSQLGFVAGVLALQWRPELPDVRTCVLAAALFACLALLLRRVDVGGDPAVTHSDGAGRTTATTWVTRLRTARWGALILLAAACGGFGHAAWRAETRLSDALPGEWENRDITVVGVIDDLPFASPRGARFAFVPERVVTEDAHVPARVSLAWFAPQRGDGPAVPVLHPGERWRLTVRLKRPHGNVNPHGFDLEAWLLENEFRATGYVRAAGDVARLDAFAGRPGDHVQRAREKVRDRIEAALRDAPYRGVIVALTIGEQRAIPERQWLVFNRTGITHLISISGLHVTVFAALAAACVHALARRVPMLTSRIAAHRVAALVGAMCAFAYVLLAGAQTPAQRTLIMLIVAAIGLWIARPGTARTVWLWALVAVLAFDPWAGVTPGFWLSFGAVGLLLHAGGARLFSRARSFWERQRRTLRAALHAQAVVTVGLVPLTLAVFQQVSLIAPVANALAIPVVTFAVVPLALGAIALPFEWPWQVAHAVFSWLMVPLEALAHTPGSVWQQHAPLGWTVPVAMAGIVWMFAPRGLPLRWMGALSLAPLFWAGPEPPRPGDARLVVLDVGQGLAALVQTARHALLYDTGPRYTDEADAGGRIVAPYLRASGAPTLGAMIVSHLDADHSGGARSITQVVPVQRLISSVAADHPLWRELGRDVERCHAGQTWQWDGVTFTVLHPPAEWYALDRLRTNDLSCVLRIDSAGGSALLTGDIEARAEQAVLQNPAISADVLVVPHHGSRTSSTSAFIAGVRPAFAIFTAGYRNRFGHPREDIVARYTERGVAVLRTDLQGALTIEFTSGRPIRVTAERERYRRYWFDVPVGGPAE